MEVWKDIEGYEGLYQVSNLGNVKSFPRHGTRTNQVFFLSQSKDSKGYMRVWLSNGKVQKNFKVHRLVASAFVENPNNLPQVNHKDENKQNNNANNLEWCDNRYNSVYNGRMERIAKKLGRKVRCIETNEVFCSASEASRQTGITYSSIVYVCQGKFKQAKGYHFKYED